MPSVFDLTAILLVLTAGFGWLNHVLFRLPHTIGLLLMGLVASLVLVGLELALPQVTVYENLTELLRRIDFKEAVLNGMLALKGMLAFGVGLLWWISGLLGMGISLAWAVQGLSLREVVERSVRT